MEARMTDPDRLSRTPWNQLTEDEREVIRAEDRLGAG
jgi:hypothetical protein